MNTPPKVTNPSLPIYECADGTALPILYPKRRRFLFSTKRHPSELGVFRQAFRKGGLVPSGVMSFRWQYDGVVAGLRVRRLHERLGLFRAPSRKPAKAVSCAVLRASCMRWHAPSSAEIATLDRVGHHTF